MGIRLSHLQCTQDVNDKENYLCRGWVEPGGIIYESKAQSRLWCNKLTTAHVNKRIDMFVNIVYCVL